MLRGLRVSGLRAATNFWLRWTPSGLGQVTLCSRCFMAIGETAYGDTADGKSTCVHPECMAQAGRFSERDAQ